MQESEEPYSGSECRKERSYSSERFCNSTRATSIKHLAQSPATSFRSSQKRELQEKCQVRIATYILQIFYTYNIKKLTSMNAFNLMIKT